MSRAQGSTPTSPCWSLSVCRAALSATPTSVSWLPTRWATFATTFTVQREVGILGGPLTDCLSTPCVVRAQSGNDPLAQENQVVLGFANVALPTKPVLTVTPNTGLGARQAVTVAGHGYGANETLTLNECTRTSTFANYTCFFFQSGAVTDATGSFTTTLTARRFIPGSPQQVDCAPSACLIAAYSYDDVLASSGADINFDPNAPRPPPPTVTVSPSTGLVNGPDVTVSGAEYSPNASIGMSQCRAGATSPLTATSPSAASSKPTPTAASQHSSPFTPSCRSPVLRPADPLAQDRFRSHRPPAPSTAPPRPVPAASGRRTSPDYTEGARALLSFATTTVAPPSASNSPSTAPGTATTGRSGGTLAFTGTSTSADLIALGAAAIALGATLVGLNRRRHRHLRIN